MASSTLGLWRTLLLSLLLYSIPTCCAAAKKKTRHKDKPPGWRPDRPKETGIEIVEKMLRTLGPSIVSGAFFSEYQRTVLDMQAANEKYLRPASLLPGGMHATVDAKMEASMKAAAAARTTA